MHETVDPIAIGRVKKMDLQFCV